MSNRDALVRFRYRYIPDHVIGELLAKRWMDNAIPFLALIVVLVVFGRILPDFYSLSNITDLSRQFAETGLVVLGLTIVMLSGGIDLSVGSVFGLAVLTASICMNVWNLGVGVTLLACIALGIVCGAINGILVGYLRLRAFLTTLVTLIVFRSIYEMVFPGFSTAIVGNIPDSPIWDFIGNGTVLGVPFSFVVTAIIAMLWHVVLSRMRPGWRLMAVGGARRSAHNAGISVRRTICNAYIWSSVLCCLAGFFNAARLGSTGSDTGVGMEITALTAVVLGGNSLGGGRGSVAKAVLGTVIVLILTNALIALSVPGPVNSTILGIVLIAAVFVDVRWLKNRHKILNKVYVSPTYFAPPPPPSTAPDSDSPYALNDKLRSVGAVGLGIIEGAEDMILDREDNLYCGNRHGDIMRFFGPDHTRHEIFAHVGGQPLGLAFEPNGNLDVCIGGMGLYQITPDRKLNKLSDETNRTLFSVVDDFAAAACRRSRHRSGRPRLLQRGHDPFRNARMAGRRAGEPRQRTDHLLRSEDRPIAHRSREPDLPERHLHAAGRRILLFRRNLRLPGQPLLLCRPEERPARHRHRQHAGLSRQHQSRVGRQLLARDRRHAFAGA